MPERPQNNGESFFPLVDDFVGPLKLKEPKERKQELKESIEGKETRAFTSSFREEVRSHMDIFRWSTLVAENISVSGTIFDFVHKRKLLGKINTFSLFNGETFEKNIGFGNTRKLKKITEGSRIALLEGRVVVIPKEHQYSKKLLALLPDSHRDKEEVPALEKEDTPEALEILIDTEFQNFLEKEFTEQQREEMTDEMRVELREKKAQEVLENITQAELQEISGNKDAFRKKIDLTLKEFQKIFGQLQSLVGENLSYEDVERDLNMNLHFLSSKPENQQLTPKEFNSLCTEMRLFYIRKLFMTMSGDNYRILEDKIGKKGINKLLKLRTGAPLWNPEIFEEKVGAYISPNLTYVWDMKNVEHPSEKVYIDEFIDKNKLRGKPYKDYLHAVEDVFGLPKNLLIALAWHESKGDVFAVSTADAKGLFQMKKKVRNNHKMIRTKGNLKNIYPEFHGNVNPSDMYTSAFRAAEKLAELKERGWPWKKVVQDYNGGANKIIYEEKVRKEYKILKYEPLIY